MRQRRAQCAQRRRKAPLAVPVAASLARACSSRASLCLRPLRLPRGGALRVRLRRATGAPAPSPRFAGAQIRALGAPLPGRALRRWWRGERLWRKGFARRFAPLAPSAPRAPAPPPGPGCRFAAPGRSSHAGALRALQAARLGPLSRPGIRSRQPLPVHTHPPPALEGGGAERAPACLFPVTVI